MICKHVKVRDVHVIPKCTSPLSDCDYEDCVNCEFLEITVTYNIYKN
jgi:hypothetical protein